MRSVRDTTSCSRDELGSKSLAAWTPILSDLVGRIRRAFPRFTAARHTALYLAPTKALAADQQASLMSLLSARTAKRTTHRRAPAQKGA